MLEDRLLTAVASNCKCMQPPDFVLLSRKTVMQRLLPVATAAVMHVLDYFAVIRSAPITLGRRPLLSVNPTPPALETPKVGITSTLLFGEMVRPTHTGNQRSWKEDAQT